MVRVILSVPVLLVAIAVHALDREKLVLRVERDEHGFAAQSSLVFEGTKLKIVRNSNFNCPSSEKVSLGLFEKQMDQEDQVKKGLVQQVMKRRHSFSGGENPSSKLQSTRYFVGSLKITDENTTSLIDRTVGSYCKIEDQKNIRFIKAVTGLIEIGKESVLKMTKFENGKSKDVSVSLVKAPCKRDESYIRCQLLDFGEASWNMVQ